MRSSVYAAVTLATESSWTAIEARLRDDTSLIDQRVVVAIILSLA
jgi:hypothetical protein